jgi:endonuclease YncB( thermonuclease family)
VGPERLTVRALVVALLLVAAGCDDGATPPAPGGDESEQATVAWVNDGDTLTLTGGAKVRLVQIDAPELQTDCYGRAALRALRGLTPKGTRVTLVRDPDLDARDRYGRLLRYVYRGQRNVNVELVRRGAASPYYFRKKRGEHADQLDAAVQEAREERAGYWGSCAAAELNTGLGSVTGPA